MKEDGDSQLKQVQTCQQVQEPKKKGPKGKRNHKKREIKPTPPKNGQKISAAGDCRQNGEDPKNSDGTTTSKSCDNPTPLAKIPYPIDSSFRRAYFDFEPINLVDPFDPELSKKGVSIDNFKIVEASDGKIKKSSKKNMPKISASSNGVITVELPFGIEVDFSIEQNLRVRTPKFTVMSTANGHCSAMIHESALMLQEGPTLNGNFPPTNGRCNEKNVVIGQKGVVFAVSNNPKVYHLNLNSNPMIRQFNKREVDFPNMKFDFASQIFFSKCPFSEKRLKSCHLWLKTANISRMIISNETHYQISIGPLLISLVGDERLVVSAAPQKLEYEMRSGAAQLRNGPKITLSAENNGTAYMKMDKKRVHISCSGIVASDQAVIASIDSYGQFSHF